MNVHMARQPQRTQQAKTAAGKWLNARESGRRGLLKQIFKFTCWKDGKLGVNDLKIYTLLGRARDVCTCSSALKQMTKLVPRHSETFSQWSEKYTWKVYFFHVFPLSPFNLLKCRIPHTHSRYQVICPELAECSNSLGGGCNRGVENWWHSTLSYWVIKTHRWITDFPFMWSRIKQSRAPHGVTQL